MPKDKILKSYNILENQKNGPRSFFDMSSIEMQPLVHRSLIIIQHESPLERLRKLLVYYGLIADKS